MNEDEAIELTAKMQRVKNQRGLSKDQALKSNQDAVNWAREMVRMPERPDAQPKFDRVAKDYVR